MVAFLAPLLMSAASSVLSKGMESKGDSKESASKTPDSVFEGSIVKLKNGQEIPYEEMAKAVASNNKEEKSEKSDGGGLLGGLVSSVLGGGKEGGKGLLGGLLG